MSSVGHCAIATLRASRTCRSDGVIAFHSSLLRMISSAEATSNVSGRAVRQEDAQSDDRGHDLGGDSHRGQAPGPQPPDDSGVDQQEQRGSDQRAQSGQCQGHDGGPGWPAGLRVGNRSTSAIGHTRNGLTGHGWTVTSPRGHPAVAGTRAEVSTSWTDRQVSLIPRARTVNLQVSGS